MAICCRILQKLMQRNFVRTFSNLSNMGNLNHCNSNILTQPLYLHIKDIRIYRIVSYSSTEKQFSTTSYKCSKEKKDEQKSLDISTAKEKCVEKCAQVKDKIKTAFKSPPSDITNNTTPRNTSLLRSVMDVIGFLIISTGIITRSIIRLALPSSYKPKKSCCGEIVLITGGGGGIGRLLAMRLASLGSTVVIWDIAETGIDETVKLVECCGGKVHGFKCNIADREDVYKVAKQVQKEIGDVTILINNAGVYCGDFLLETPDDLIQRTFDVNIMSHFWTVKAFLPSMIEKNRGHIVTISSLAGYIGLHKMVDYCSSKYATVGFDESLKIELEVLGANGLKLTRICPYFIQSTGLFTDVNSRFLPALKSNAVADRIVLAIRREEHIVTLPAYFNYTIFLKGSLPWEVYSMFIRNLVPDPQINKIARKVVEPVLKK